MKKLAKGLILSTLLALCLFVAVFAEEASAAVVDSGTCGENVNWTLYDDGLLRITGSGAMNGSGTMSYGWLSHSELITKVEIGGGLTSIGRAAFSHCSALTSVTIPTGVIYIGDSAFRKCSSLTSVTIPENVVSIGPYAFSSCSSLSSVTIPEGVTSIGAQTFRDCSSLTSVTIPERVTSIGSWAFNGCSALTSVTIPEGVTSISSGAFGDCTSLVAITVDDQNKSYKARDNVLFSIDGTKLIAYPGGIAGAYTIPEGVISLDHYAFDGCSKLTSVTIPEGVTSIGRYAFDNCNSLTSAVIPESVTSIGEGAFRGCSSLISVTIPAGITSISDYAFSGCSSLISVPIPEGVTSIGGGVFSDCSSLTSVTIPASVTYIGDEAFVYCTSLVEFTVDDQNKNYKAQDHVLFSINGTTLIAYPGGVAGAYTIPEGVTAIADCAFLGCSKLTSVTIPESVTYIGLIAFYDCEGLAAIIFRGSVPEHYESSIFGDVTATAYYPADDPSWTEAAREALGDDAELSWKPYTREPAYHAQFSLDAIPQNAFELAVTITRLNASEEDVALTALYSPEGRFLGVTIQALSGDITQTVTISADNRNGSIGSIRVFILDSLQNFTPIMESIGI